jgi:hypothetical protein
VHPLSIIFGMALVLTFATGVLSNQGWSPGGKADAAALAVAAVAKEPVPADAYGRAAAVARVAQVKGAHAGSEAGWRAHCPRCGEMPWPGSPEFIEASETRTPVAADHVLVVTVCAE